MRKIYKKKLKSFTLKKENTLSQIENHSRLNITEFKYYFHKSNSGFHDRKTKGKDFPVDHFIKVSLGTLVAGKVGFCMHFLESVK